MRLNLAFFRPVDYKLGPEESERQALYGVVREMLRE